MKAFYSKGTIEAGCDEAGRGCLAGPVFAAAVILPHDFHHPDLNDSKLLDKAKRTELKTIIEKHAIAWSVSRGTPKMIDKINILNASFRAMHHCIKKLNPLPDLLLIDGNLFNPFNGIAHRCIIKGDSKYASIAAASILAKTYRDRYMEKIHKNYPEYYWNTNKGYPTEEHRNAIKLYGPTIHHRRSFRLYPLGKQGSLF